MNLETYSSAGVNINRAEKFVERLKTLSRRPNHSLLWPGAGGYAAIYPITDECGVAITTDGVGTKLLVAHALSSFDTIGIDLVAMCANDLICVGAKPALFLDYIACGKLDDASADKILAGIVAGCDQAGMILAGGETAEMPGLYNEGHYDLAGFALGQVKKQGLITGQAISPGQALIGVASSGIHSNGLSLARKVIAKAKWNSLLTPTSIYVKPVMDLLEKHQSYINGIAHITGGGWRNIFRLNENVGYHITNPLPIPDIFKEISTNVSQDEMYKTFNMGMGLCLITSTAPDTILKVFHEHNFHAQVIGFVTDQKNTLTIEGTSILLKG